MTEPHSTEEENYALPGEMARQVSGSPVCRSAVSPDSSESVVSCRKTFMRDVTQTLTKHLTKLSDGIREDIREELQRSLQGYVVTSPKSNRSRSKEEPFGQKSTVGSMKEPLALAWHPLGSDRSEAKGNHGIARFPAGRQSEARRESVMAEFLNIRYNMQPIGGKTSRKGSNVTSTVASPEPFGPRSSKSMPPPSSSIAQKLDNVLQNLGQAGKSKKGKRLSTASNSIFEEEDDGSKKSSPPNSSPQHSRNLKSEDHGVDTSTTATSLKPADAKTYGPERTWEPVVSMMSDATEYYMPEDSCVGFEVSASGEDDEVKLMEVATSEHPDPCVSWGEEKLEGSRESDDPMEDAETTAVVSHLASDNNWMCGTSSLNSVDLSGFKRPKRNTANYINTGLTSVTACLQAMDKHASVKSVDMGAELGLSSTNSRDSFASTRDSEDKVGMQVETARSCTSQRGRRSGISGSSRQPTQDFREYGRFERYSTPIISVVGHKRFDYFMGALILLNAATTGIQIDYMAKHATKVIPTSFRVIEVMFCIIYAVELPLRLLVQKQEFFTGPAWRWNLFDFFLVTSQIIEELLGVIEPEQDSHSQFFGVIRGMRILRLLRIFRVVSVLRPINELNMIIKAILGSLRSLFWTIVLLFFIIYIIGAYLTQLVSDHMIDQMSGNRARSETEVVLQTYFGGVLVSIFSLYQAMAGGIDWDFLTAPLMEHISPWLGLLFSFYIAFAVLALMNIVTGVFVQSALNDARESSDEELVTMIQRQFKMIDIGNTGVVSREEFEAHMSSAQMRTYLKKLNLDVNEAMDLFHILDTDGSGDISYHEFAQGCLRLRKQAKAIDLVALMQHSRRTFDDFEATLSEMDAHMTNLLQSIDTRLGDREKGDKAGTIT